MAHESVLTLGGVTLFEYLLTNSLISAVPTNRSQCDEREKMASVCHYQVKPSSAFHIALFETPLMRYRYQPLDIEQIHLTAMC